MRLHIAICDDEPVLCNKAKDIMLEIQSEYEIDTYSSGVNLLASHFNYDVIFLDVEMPELNGMQVAKRLRDRSYRGEIVFLTSHSEYMPEAFKVRAFRYLTKPVRKDELVELLEDIENDMFENETILVDSFGSEKLIHIRDIVYIESRKKNSVIHTIDEGVETSFSLKYWMERLSENEFCQVHKSYIAAFKYITQIEADTLMLREADARIPISRRRYNDVRRAFFDYVRRHARIL